MHKNLKLDKKSEIEFFQEYKYLGVIFDTNGTDDKEIRSTRKEMYSMFKRDTVE